MEDEDLMDLVPAANTDIRDRAKIKAIMDVKCIDEQDLSKEQKAFGEAKRKSLVYEFSIGEMSAMLCSRKNAMAVMYFLLFLRQFFSIMTITYALSYLGG